MYIPTSDCNYLIFEKKQLHEPKIVPAKPAIQNYHGVNKFLQRQNAARDERARKEALLAHKPMTNPNKITIPRNPNFAYLKPEGDRIANNFNSNQNPKKKMSHRQNLEVNF